MKEVLKSKKVRLSIAAGIILVLLIVLGVMLFGDTKLPEGFTESREAAALASEQVSQLLNESVQNLSLIARYEREERFVDAEALAQEELSKSSVRNEAAIDLASAIEGIARTAIFIESGEAKEEALKAVSLQISAITHILSYNDLFHRLVGEINLKLLQGLDNGDRINELLDQLNEESEEINRLNEGFTNALKTFDAILKIE